MEDLPLISDTVVLVNLVRFWFKKKSRRSVHCRLGGGCCFQRERYDIIIIIAIILIYYLVSRTSRGVLIKDFIIHNTKATRIPTVASGLPQDGRGNRSFSTTV